MAIDFHRIMAAMAMGKTASPNPASSSRKELDPFSLENQRMNSSISGSGSLPNHRNSTGVYHYQGPTGEHAEAQVQTIIRPKSTCDKDVRDRIIAMLARYDPDSFLVFDEDADIPDTQVGNSFLHALMETHGPEPASKQIAIENLLRRLLERQDPARLKSIKTLVAAAESSGKEAQIVRALFSAYGLTHQAGKFAASSGLSSDVVGNSSSGGGGNFSSPTSSPQSFLAFNSSPMMSIRGGLIIDNTSSIPTSTAILSPFYQVGGVSGWSPDASVRAQQDTYATSPRLRPLRTKQDLLDQLSGSPKVQKTTNHHARAPSFSDLLMMDTEHGEEPIDLDLQQTRANENQLSHLALFQKTAAGEEHRVTAVEKEAESITVRNTSSNPFLSNGAQPRNASMTVNLNKSSTSSVIPDFPKTPPNIDLGPFGRL